MYCRRTYRYREMYRPITLLLFNYPLFFLYLFFFCKASIGMYIMDCQGVVPFTRQSASLPKIHFFKFDTDLGSQKEVSISRNMSSKVVSYPSLLGPYSNTQIALAPYFTSFLTAKAWESLRNAASAMEPDYTRMLVDDWVFLNKGLPLPAAMMDLNMMEARRISGIRSWG